MKVKLLIVVVVIVCLIQTSSAMVGSAGAVASNNFMMMQQQYQQSIESQIENGCNAIVNLNELAIEDKWYLIDVFKWVEDPRVIVKLVLYNPMVDDFTVISGDVKQYYKGDYKVGVTWFKEVNNFMKTDYQIGN